MREAEYKQQLDDLKRLATEAHEAHCSAAAAAASGSGRLAEDGAGEGVAGLRARIEEAIEVVQSGLVERDTEVGGGSAASTISPPAPPAPARLGPPATAAPGYRPPLRTPSSTPNIKP